MSIIEDINQIPPAGPLTGNELVVGVQDGNGVLMTLYQALSLPAPVIAATPTAFTATAISDVQIDLTWSGSGDNYIVEFCRENNGAWIENYNGPATSYSSLDLYGDENYFYRVKSQKTGEFDSAWAYADATTLTPP